MVFTQSLRVKLYLLFIGMVFLTPNSVMAKDKIDYSISPRFYLSALSIGGVKGGVDLSVMPMAGLSFTVYPLEHYDFTFNFLYGGASNDTPSEMERVDIELLIRRTFTDSPFYFSFGYRYVNFKYESGIYKEDNNAHLIEFGPGFSTSISDNNKHSLFANLVLGIGAFDIVAENPTFNDDGFSYGIDGNIGYQYLISRAMSISTRYRIIALHSFGSELQSNVLAHGPDIAFTYRF